MLNHSWKSGGGQSKDTELRIFTDRRDPKGAGDDALYVSKLTCLLINGCSVLVSVIRKRPGKLGSRSPYTEPRKLLFIRCTSWSIVIARLGRVLPHQTGQEGKHQKMMVVEGPRRPVTWISA